MEKITTQLNFSRKMNNIYLMYSDKCFVNISVFCKKGKESQRKHKLVKIFQADLQWKGSKF